VSQNAPGMPRPPSNGPNGGRITDQVQTTEVYAGGRPTQGVRVYFKTGKGRDGSVFIPDAQYNPANVIATASKAANDIDALHDARI